MFVGTQDHPLYAMDVLPLNPHTSVLLYAIRDGLVLAALCNLIQPKCLLVRLLRAFVWAA